MGSLVIALLSGAVGGSLITGLLNLIEARSKIKIRYVRDQIDHFYGPLYIIISISDQCFNLSGSIQSEHRAYFTGQKWSQDDATQNKLNQESENTIDISNKYWNEGIANCEKIFSILINNYSLADPDDIEMIDDFVQNFKRLKIEIEGKQKLPFEIYKSIGDIAILRDDFRKHFMNKFRIKKEKLNVETWLNKCKKKFSLFFQEPEKLKNSKTIK